MALTPKLEIRQSQSLLMTPQLRQAINLLQMSNLELNELLEQELNSNPLLEREEDRLNESPDLPALSIDEFNADDKRELPESGDFEPDVDYDNNFDDDFASDREGYETDNDYAWSDYNRSKTGGTDEDFDYFEKKLADTQSLYRQVENQITLNFTAPRQRIIAGLLSEQLDAAGYFRGKTADIAKALKTTENEITDVLQKLKTFEPSGLFAQDLKECLEIQLRDINRYDPAIACLLDNLDLLAERKFKELKKLCKVDDEDLASMIDDIKSLNPKPAASYKYDLTTYVIPDVYVRRNKDASYHLELNNMSLPRLLINRQYYADILSGKTDRQAKRYLKDNLAQANFLLKALHQRATTILRVSEEIVKQQHEFFEHGIDRLKPMSLKDVAYNLEMHESTVSRVTNRKYMQTPRGLFELKYFFSAAAGTYTGAEDISTLSIKNKIKQLINEEAPTEILSDDKIVELLAREGIKIARRTVAKYREAQSIPTSAERKRLKRNNI